jgi:transcriptional regulator with XRE-family HTH domain
LFPKTIHSKQGWLIAKRIAELRSKKGLTKRDLAERLGRERGLVCRIEICERRVELAELVEVFTVIGCNVKREINRHVTNLLEISFGMPSVFAFFF